jgi:two-component system, NarL family, nitrate/nitrite response regulator NarL
VRVVLIHEGSEWPKSLGGQTLTKRQVEIVRLVARGLPNKRIAGRLGIEVGTVKIHLHNIYQKLQISGRSRLATLSRENLSPNDGQESARPRVYRNALEE